MINSHWIYLIFNKWLDFFAIITWLFVLRGTLWSFTSILKYLLKIIFISHQYFWIALSVHLSLTWNEIWIFLDSLLAWNSNQLLICLIRWSYQTRWVIRFVAEYLLMIFMLLRLKISWVYLVKVLLGILIMYFIFNYRPLQTTADYSRSCIIFYNVFKLFLDL
jgi:hypothetical protein